MSNSRVGCDRKYKEEYTIVLIIHTDGDSLRFCEHQTHLSSLCLFYYDP